MMYLKNVFFSEQKWWTTKRNACLKINYSPQHRRPTNYFRYMLKYMRKNYIFNKLAWNTNFSFAHMLAMRMSICLPCVWAYDCHAHEHMLAMRMSICLPLRAGKNVMYENVCINIGVAIWWIRPSLTSNPYNN